MAKNFTFGIIILSFIFFFSVGIQIASANEASRSIALSPVRMKVLPITLFSPNGGEVWKKGETQNILWKNYSEKRKTRVYLEEYYPVGSIHEGSVKTSTLLGVMSRGRTIYKYQVPGSPTFPDSDSKSVFKIKVCSDQKCINNDSSNAYFTITK